MDDWMMKYLSHYHLSEKIYRDPKQRKHLIKNLLVVLVEENLTHMYNKVNVNMVNKQAIDNSLYMMDNEVRNPFVQMTRERERAENAAVVFFLFLFYSLIGNGR
jgi:hypothetical protein